MTIKSLRRRLRSRTRGSFSSSGLGGSSPDPTIEILTTQPDRVTPLGVSSRRLVLITNANGGTWRGGGWAFGNTTDIAYNATYVQVRDELRATQGTSDVTVYTPVGLAANQHGWNIDFNDDANAAAFTIAQSSLT